MILITLIYCAALAKTVDFIFNNWLNARSEVFAEDKLTTQGVLEAKRSGTNVLKQKCTFYQRRLTHHGHYPIKLSNCHTHFNSCTSINNLNVENIVCKTSNPLDKYLLFCSFVSVE